MLQKFKGSKIYFLKRAAQAVDKPTKCFCLILLLVFLALSGWSCVSIICFYFKYPIKTTIVKEKRENVPFPAISFSNMHPVRGSGVHPVMFEILGYLYGDQGENENGSTLEIMEKTCKSSSSYSFQLMASGYQVSAIVRDMSMDSFVSTKNCWYMNKRIPCEAIFMNTLTDFGLGFTFNPNSRVRNMMAANEDPKDPIEYGLTTTEFFNLNTSNIGPSSGFRVELDINAEEMCGPFHKYKGAGFIIMVHDPSLLLSFYSLTPSFFLSPGNYYDIAVRAQFINRKTKHLGLCYDSWPLNSTANMFYTKEFCRGICFLYELIENCQCVTAQVQTYLNILGRLGWKSAKNTRRTCVSPDELRCFGRAFTMISDHQISCPVKCLPSCQEIQYQIQIKSTSYPLGVKRNGTLFANFYVDSLMVEVVEESQSYLVSDLTLDLAGAIYTFVGLSFMQLAEIIFSFFVCATKVLFRQNRVSAL